MKKLVHIGCIVLLASGCTAHKTPSAELSQIERAAGMSQSRIEKLAKKITPGMSEEEVIAIVGTKPEMTNSGVWTYFGRRSANADMRSDLAIRFKDERVSAAWVSWICIYRTPRE